MGDRENLDVVARKRIELDKASPKYVDSLLGISDFYPVALEIRELVMGDMILRSLYQTYDTSFENPLDVLALFMYHLEDRGFYREGRIKRLRKGSKHLEVSHEQGEKSQFWNKKKWFKNRHVVLELQDMRDRLQEYVNRKSYAVPGRT